MLPFIAVGVLGWGAKKLYDSFSDDDKTTTYSNRNEKEAEAREHTRADKKKKIKQKIKTYKKQQIKRLKDKYDVDVQFSSATIGNSSEVFYSTISSLGFEIQEAQDKDMFDKRTAEKIQITKKDRIDSIVILENEVEEIINLIGELEVEKHDEIS